MLIQASLPLCQYSYWGGTNFGLYEGRVGLDVLILLDAVFDVPPRTIHHLRPCLESDLSAIWQLVLHETHEGRWLPDVLAAFPDSLLLVDHRVLENPAILAL